MTAVKRGFGKCIHHLDYFFIPRQAIELLAHKTLMIPVRIFYVSKILFDEDFKFKNKSCFAVYYTFKC